MRRLPVYFLLDTSGSMFGEPIQALNSALSDMLAALRADPQAMDSLWLSIITFDREVKELVPLTELQQFQLPEISCPKSGPTLTGQALEMLLSLVGKQVRKGNSSQKGDWRPLLFIFTDGKPSDIKKYKEFTPKIRSGNFGIIVACAAGQKADEKSLEGLADKVVHLETTDSHTLRQFFKWVSEAIDQGNKSMGTTGTIELPPPPSNEYIVI